MSETDDAFIFGVIVGGAIALGMVMWLGTCEGVIEEPCEEPAPCLCEAPWVHVCCVDDGIWINGTKVVSVWNSTPYKPMYGSLCGWFREEM